MISSGCLPALVRHGLAATSLVVAWMVAYTEGPARDAHQHLVFLGGLGLATLLVRPEAAWTWRLVLGVLLLSLLLALRAAIPLDAALAVAAGVVVVLGWVWGCAARNSAALATSLLFALGVAGVANAIVGLFQWLGMADVFWPYVYVPEGSGIAMGATRQRNLYATQMVLAILAWVGLRAQGRVSSTLTMLSCALCAMALAASSSRVGMLELGVLTAVLALSSVRRKVWTDRSLWLMVAATAIAWACIYGLSELAAALSTSYESTSSRLAVTAVKSEPRWQIWEDAWGMALARPWLGWGWMQYGYGYYMAAPEGSGITYPSHAHNLYLNLAVELGLPVAALVLIWTTWLAGRLLRTVWLSGTDAAGNLQAMSALMFMAIGLHSLVEFPLWNFTFLFLAAASLAMALKARDTESPEAASPLRRIFPMLLGTLLILGSAAAWRDYEKVLAISRVPWRNVEKEVEALETAGQALLFRPYVEYERLHRTQITPDNAREILARSQALIHFTQSPGMIERIIKAHMQLGEVEQAAWHAERYRRFYDQAFPKWACRNPVWAQRLVPDSARNCPATLEPKP